MRRGKKARIYWWNESTPAGRHYGIVELHMGRDAVKRWRKKRALSAGRNLGAGVPLCGPIHQGPCKTFWSDLEHTSPSSAHTK